MTVTAEQQDPDVADSPFPNLSVTVSQTADLVSQGVRLTYSGGTQSSPPSSSNNGQDFLQFMECWGDLKDASGNPIKDKDGNPQPDRTTCQYGSANVNQGQRRYTTLASADQADPVDVSAGYFYPGSGFFDSPRVSIPFNSVTGKTLASVVDGKLITDPSTGNLVNLDSNEFYGPYTTNEVPWAGFGGDGTGSSTFEVQTGMQAPGLGCGNPVTAADGAVTGQPCWLVIVPRGANDGIAAVGNTGSSLLWQIWKHHLAVRLDFKPLGVRCPLGAAERQVAGSELVSLALQSWQPAVCNQAGGSIYNVVTSSEGDAASKANGTGSAPLALVSRPLDTVAYGATDNLTYAPIAVTGLTIAFAVDHNSNPLSPPPAAIQAKNALPFTQMNLTPRLVAKLLTNSYRNSVPSTASVPYLDGNPGNIAQDPDFLLVNPDWAGQSIYSVALADVFVPLGHSDSAWTVWNYVMSDKDARDFLDGEPDPWGMKVNPWATTNADWDATVNPPGVANEYPTDRFFKPDPSEGQLVEGDAASTVDAIAWRPYSLSFDQGGYWVLRGDRREIFWNAGAASGGTGAATFATYPRDTAGQQKVMGLTDTASAAKYQVYTASLENPAGKFVTPTLDSMSAAAAAMTPDATQPQVVEFDPESSQAKAAESAYPLTVPVYAATNSAGGDAGSRTAAASLIRYAAGAGQTPGTSLGQLPPGYAPIPARWRTQALAAADTIAAESSQPTSQPTSEPTGTSSPSDEPSTPAAGLPVPPASGLPGTGLPSGPPPSATGPAPAPSPTPSGPPPPVLGATTPADSGTGALGSAVPISGGAGLLAAAIVPFVGRRPRRPL
ncbi:MAG TPA: hypothetical protein VGC04_10320 [Cellulomonas sp.]